MSRSKPRVRVKASTVKNGDRWAFRRPLGAFIFLFVISLITRAFLQDSPLTWLNVLWAAAFAFCMTAIQEFFGRGTK